MQIKPPTHLRRVRKNYKKEIPNQAGGSVKSNLIDTNAAANRITISA